MQESVKRQHLRDIRTRNRTRLLRLLSSNDALSRRDLHELSGLTLASVSRITKELIDEDLCYEGESYRTDNPRGRSRVEVCINPHGGAVVAICLSAYSWQIAITDLLGSTSYLEKIPARINRNPDATIQFIGEYINKLIKNGKVKREKLLGTTVVIAGSIDQQSGELLSAPLIDWHGVALKEGLSAVLGLSVNMYNIADALCMSYISGPGEETESRQSLFFVHTAIGMGASFAINGQIVKRRGGEGWIEQVSVPEFSTTARKPMRLGEISSGRAILAALADDTKKAGSKKMDTATRLQLAVGAANNSSPREQSLFKKAGHALGKSLVSLTAAYLPDRIVLAGPLAEAQVYCEAVKDGFHEIAGDTDSNSIEITTNRTTYIQAAQNLALSEYIYS